MQTATTPATALTVALSPADRLMLPVVRRNIMQRMASAVFTDVERLRANDSVYQCESIAQLMTWHRNVCRVELERKTAQQVAQQAAAATAPAMPAQLSEIVRLCGNPVITRREASCILFRLRHLTHTTAEKAIDLLAAAIWDRDAGAARHLSELTAILGNAGISHQHLLIS